MKISLDINMEVYQVEILDATNEQKKLFINNKSVSLDVTNTSYYDTLIKNGCNIDVAKICASNIIFYFGEQSNDPATCDVIDNIFYRLIHEKIVAKQFKDGDNICISGYDLSINGISCGRLPYCRSDYESWNLDAQIDKALIR